ncbi:vWA domain-containing protein [Variovorax sp. dw_308]|uniref:vWA domain-containing protein n=1 Tax=Variovorax sp. dw_308 TaxID=2721546 RepID=UPI001C439F5D|nr:vWA domain-containing protein [Variovorax sp. dw_308]
MTAHPAWWHQADRGLLALAAAVLAASLFDPAVMTQRPLVDHVVVIDVTQSMNVLDERIDGEPASRLDFAKQALRQSLLQLPCGSKVGWAVFTEYRALLLLSPIEVCANLKELRSTLARIDTRMAWSGNSEIAKGLHSAIGIAKLLPDKPSLVFITDGQEAPPLNPHYRPAFDDKPGDVTGLVVGVGDLRPSPIPKTDPEGRPLGFWRADEVAQTDLRSQGRNASVRSETMVDDTVGTSAPTLGATPGTEHLSALRETYLRLLAGEQGLEFVRLQSPERLAQALTSPALARPEPARSSLAGMLGAVAFGLLLLRYVVPLLFRRRPSRAGLKTRAS